MTNLEKLRTGTDEKRTVAKARACPVILCGYKHPKLKLRCFT